MVNVRAANSDPATIMGKNQVFYGVLSVLLLILYRGVALNIASLPVRAEYSRKSLKHILMMDLRRAVIPLGILVGIVLAVYWYIIFTSPLSPSPVVFELYYAYSTLLLALVLAYISMYEIPSTIIQGVKRRLIIGLFASILSGATAFIIIIPSFLIPLDLWSCSASAMNIEAVNPNTQVIEKIYSINLLGILYNITFYSLYPYLLYKGAKRLNRGK